MQPFRPVGLKMVICGALMSVPSLAGFTAVGPPPGSEATHKEILEGIYGGTFVGMGTDLGSGLWTSFANGSGVVATRVDDEGFPTLLNLITGAPGTGDDDAWIDGSGSAEANARFAGFSQEFGYEAGAGYVKLFDVSGSGFSVSGSAMFMFAAGSTWHWARADDSDSGLSNDFYSEESLNSDGLDHMVTYHLTGVPGAPPNANCWLLFLEDIGGGGSDRDFNDLVVEIKGIPMCGNGIVEPGEDCDACPEDVSCDEPPVCPADGTVECDVSIPGPVPTDSCGPVVITGLVDIFTQGACPWVGTLTRTFTATDSCGLETDCAQAIEVVDTTPPDLTCPPDFIGFDAIECGTVTDFESFGPPPVVSDNCDPDPEVTVTVEVIPQDCSPAFTAGISPPPKETVVRTITATEGASTIVAAAPPACGNTSECTQIIEVVDTLAPVITTCPPNLSATCGDTVGFEIFSSDNNCTGPLEIECAFSDTDTPDAFTATETTNGMFEVEVHGAITVTAICTSTDECGNTSAACSVEIEADCPSVCGNGSVEPGEQCDDGNNYNGDGCSAGCLIQNCGDAIVDPGEQCDDGNRGNGDGCDATCHREFLGTIPATSNWSLAALVAILACALTGIEWIRRRTGYKR